MPIQAQVEVLADFPTFLTFASYVRSVNRYHDILRQIVISACGSTFAIGPFLEKNLISILIDVVVPLFPAGVESMVLHLPHLPGRPDQFAALLGRVPPQEHLRIVRRGGVGQCAVRLGKDHRFGGVRGLGKRSAIGVEGYLVFIPLPHGVEIHGFAQHIRRLIAFRVHPAKQCMARSAQMGFGLTQRGAEVFHIFCEIPVAFISGRIGEVSASGMEYNGVGAFLPSGIQRGAFPHPVEVESPGFGAFLITVPAGELIPGFGRLRRAGHQLAGIHGHTRGVIGRISRVRLEVNVILIFFPLCGDGVGRTYCCCILTDIRPVGHDPVQECVARPGGVVGQIIIISYICGYHQKRCLIPQRAPGGVQRNFVLFSLPFGKQSRTTPRVHQLIRCHRGRI